MLLWSEKKKKVYLQMCKLAEKYLTTENGTYRDKLMDLGCKHEIYACEDEEGILIEDEKFYWHWYQEG